MKRAILAAILLVACANASSARSLAVQPKSKKNPTAADQRGTQQAPLVITTDSSQRQRDSTERQRIVADQQIDRIERKDTDTAIIGFTRKLFIATLVLAVVTVALFGVGFWQGLLTQRALVLAREEFTAEHRPWIAVGIEPWGVLGLPEKEDGQIMLIFSFQNTGRVPAMNLWVDYEIVPPMGNALEAQRRIVRRLEESAAVANGEGISVFPNAPPATVAREYKVPLNTTNAWMKWWDETEPIRRFDKPTHIAGCVVYRSPLDKERTIRYTGFIRQLHWHVPVGNAEMDKPIEPQRRSFHAEELRTIGSPLGGGLID